MDGHWLNVTTLRLKVRSFDFSAEGTERPEGAEMNIRIPEAEPTSEWFDEGRIQFS